MKRRPSRRAVSSLRSVHNLGDDVKHLPRKNTRLLPAGGGALALRSIPATTRSTGGFDGIGAAENFFKPGSTSATPPCCSAPAPTTYVIGRGKKNGRLQHLGMDEIEGQLLAGSIVIGLKESVRRERPISERRHAGARASRFRPGTRPRRSPAATILQQHLGYKAGVPTYLVASYVAMSRLHDNVH